MIRALVFSDTHSNTLLMLEAVKRMRPDVVIHLGDYERDAEAVRREFPEIPLFNVRGNCDIGGTAPDCDVVPLGQAKAFITHGHLYNVDYGHIYSLAYAAQERGANIAMFGHTHEAVNEDFGGMKVLNPGTAGKGRELTYAVVEVHDNGAVSTEIRDL